MYPAKQDDLRGIEASTAVDETAQELTAPRWPVELSA